jgi:prevent-host-death family protein
MTVTPVASSYETAQAYPYDADMARTEFLGIESTRTKLGDRVAKAEAEELHTVMTKHGQPKAVLVDIGWYRRAREALKDPTDL